MASRYNCETTQISEAGKKALKTQVGSVGATLDVDNFNFKEHILSKYGSIEILKEKAKLGLDWQAQVDLATTYQHGLPELNIEKDPDTAIDWYETAIKSGDWVCLALNLSTLGTLHYVKGTVPHQRRAIELYTKAARLGDTLAEINLAESYRCGAEGVISRDIEEAFKWYRRAAGEELSHDDKQDKSSLDHRITAYLSGMIRQSSIDLKFKALKLLYRNYLDGDCPEGKPQRVKALYYLKKAAELGDPEAQKDLGLACLTGGSGYPKDLHKAKRWLGKAAKNGERDAIEALKKFDEKNVVDITQPETGEANFSQSIVQQYVDIEKLHLDQEEHHSFIIQNPLIFQESTFTQFPDSPTAQHYLKAFRLVKKGLAKLQSSNFSASVESSEAIKLIALGILYENSIIQSFPEITAANHFLPLLFSLICKHLKVDPNFFEGLFILINLYPKQRKVSLASHKLDFKKSMTFNNLIQLIKKAEPDKQPKVDPYNFEEDYTSWLHVLYYFLGSLYVITECNREGAEAFQEALNCCPSYYEAKMGLAYCLMNMSTKDSKEQQHNLDEELLQSFEPPKKQRIPKGDYLTWTRDQLSKKAKQLFMEYLQEAPECDKKYPNCHYHLAVLSIREGDLQEVLKWKERGEDSEEKRLPFLEPVDTVSKKALSMLDILPLTPKEKNKCSNKKCPTKKSDQLTLKPCPCHKSTYCGSKCQAADWKEHKKTCSHRK